MPLADDFEKYSKQGAEIKNPEFKDAVKGNIILGKRTSAEKVGNKVTFSRANLVDLALSGANDIGNTNYQYMTDDEVNVYNYLLAKKGDKKANEFLDALNETLNYRSAEKNFKAMKGKTGLEIAAKGVAGFDTFLTGTRATLTQKEQDRTMTEFLSPMIRQDLGNVGKGHEILGSTVGQIAGDISEFMGAMAPSILASHGVGAMAGARAGKNIGSAIMGVRIYGKTYSDTLKEGYSEKQATTYGLVDAAKEVGLQRAIGGISALGGSLSGRTFSNTIGNMKSVPGQILAKTIRNMSAEAAEEYLQEISDPVIRNKILKENNKFDPFSQDAFYAGFLGAVTAGVLETGNIIVDTTTKAKIGSEQILNGDVDALVDYAYTLKNDTEAHKIAKDIKKGKRKVNDVNIGELYIATEFEVVKQANEISKSKDYRDFMDNQLDEIINANIKAAQNEVIAMANIELDNRNVIDKNVRRAFTDVIIGDKITTKQVDNIKQDKLVSDLMQSMTNVAINENISSKEIAKKLNEFNGEFAAEVRNQMANANAEQGNSTGKPFTNEPLSIEQDVDLSFVSDVGNDFSTQDIVTPQVFQSVAEKYTPNAARTFETLYDGSLDFETYSNMFDDFYRAGRAGLNFELVQEVNPMGIEKFGSHNAFAAIEAGKQSKIERASFTQNQIKNNAKTSEKGGVYKGNDINLDKLNKAQMQVLDAIGEKYGITFLVNEELKNDANGMYHKGEKLIEISLNAEYDGYLVAAGHELTHYIKENNLSDYKELENFVVDKLSESYNMDNLIARRIALYKEYDVKITREQAIEEIVADSCFDVLSNEKFINELAKENKSLLKRIADWFKSFFSEIKKIISRLTTEEANALRDDVEALDKISQLFHTALENTKENTAIKSDGEVKYSQKLGGYNPEINATTKNILKTYGITDINKKYQVINKISEKLKQSYLSTAEKSKPITNLDTGINIEIWKNGIKETFGNDKYFKNLPSQDRINKIAVMPHLAKLIKYGEIRAPEAANYHKPNSKVTFAYLVSPITIDGKDYNVNMDIRKSPDGGNKFYIHSLQIKTDADYLAHNVKRLKDSQSSANPTISQDKNGVNSSISKNGGESDSNEKNKPSFDSEIVISRTLKDGTQLIKKNKKISSILSELFQGNRYYDFDNPERNFYDIEKWKQDLKKYQVGIANETNFYTATLANFTETQKPDREPDFVSASGSMYWYTKDGVVRGSDHWNDSVATCSWFLDGEVSNKDTCGFCKWEDFYHKTRPIYQHSNDDILLSNFNNVENGHLIYEDSVYSTKALFSFTQHMGIKDIDESDSNEKSYSLKDSQGKVLTKEQAEFFKDSKVRDEDGNLLVVYHGSPNDFTVFDTHKDTSSIIYDASFFTSNKDTAIAYARKENTDGKLYQVYLNSVNPVMPSERTRQVKEIPKDVRDRYINEFDVVSDARNSKTTRLRCKTMRR